MLCKSCRTTIPAQRLRVLPGTLHCASCSSEEPVGCVDIVYHKTGNTIQIMPREQAQAINKSARRSGFGSLASMRGGSSSEKTGAYVHQVPLIRQATREDFNLAGERVMHFIELGMRERALVEVKEAGKSRLITPPQIRQLNAIIDQFLPPQAREEVQREVYVADDTKWVFANWRNSKTRR